VDGTYGDATIKNPPVFAEKDLNKMFEY